MLVDVSTDPKTITYFITRGLGWFFLLLSGLFWPDREKRILD